MNVINKTPLLPLAALLLTAGLTTAQAAVVESTQFTKTADIVFAGASKASINITPVNDLNAGPIPTGTEVARASVSVGSGIVAWRWTPDSGIIDTSDRNINRINLSGKNDPNNKLVLILGLESGYTPVAGDNGWQYKSYTLPDRDKASLLIRTFQQQTVAADTYTISVDAAAWKE